MFNEMVCYCSSMYFLCCEHLYLKYLICVVGCTPAFYSVLFSSRGLELVCRAVKRDSYGPLKSFEIFNIFSSDDFLLIKCN